MRGTGSALIQACEAAGATIPRCDHVHAIQHAFESEVNASDSAITTGEPFKDASFRRLNFY
jgi:hypothetical protein